MVFIFNVSFANIVPNRDSNGNVVTKNDPFGAKSNYHFRGTGASCLVAANTITACEMTITYSHVKFNGIQLLGGSLGDKVNLKVLDTATGTYTLVNVGTAIPNAVLDQFGFDWNVTDNTKEILPYVADLYTGMRVVTESNNSGSQKTVYINYYIHEE